MDPNVPLIVPEVNADAIEGFRKRNIIANPNCSTAQLVVALKPLHDRARNQTLRLCRLISLFSGAGKEAMMNCLRKRVRCLFPTRSKPKNSRSASRST